jgi:hypothetical protein
MLYMLMLVQDTISCTPLCYNCVLSLVPPPSPRSTQHSGGLAAMCTVPLPPAPVANQSPHVHFQQVIRCHICHQMPSLTCCSPFVDVPCSPPPLPLPPPPPHTHTMLQPDEASGALTWKCSEHPGELMAAMSHAMRPTAAAAAARDTHMRAVEQGEWSQSGRGRGREGGERFHIRCGSQQRSLAPGGQQG